MRRKLETMKPTKKKINQTSFFKLMLSPCSESKKLRIPKYFAKNVLRGELSSVATLTVPTGETHKVELVEEDNELWFRDGWQGFAEYFSIDYQYFLVFKYEGKSNFNVHIFDLTACEISYPCNARNTARLGHNGHDQPCNNNNVIESDGDDDNVEPEMLHKPSVMGSKKSEVGVMQQDSDDGRHVNHVAAIKYPVWMNEYYKKLVEAAFNIGMFLPEINPFFVVEIKDYALNKGRYLYIPKPFGLKHLGHKTILVKFEAFDGRRWEVKCVKDSAKYSFQGGWSVFVREIGLQVGDICIFELIDANNYVLKVHVGNKKPEICIVVD